MTPPLARLTGVTVTFPGPGGAPIRAVDRISLEIRAGEVVGIVGESGSGKSVTGLSLIGLVEFSGGKLREGEVEIEGVRLTGAGPDAWRRVRGHKIGMIFQEPMSSLNPLLTIGAQLQESLARAGKGGAGWRAGAIQLLEAVQIPAAPMRLRQYPHELSGGMRQRVMIAMTLAQEPGLIIADEPTTALDATVQREVVELLRGLRDERGLGVLFISHDLALVGEFCDRLVVMYAGRIVETGVARDVLRHPRHPYTALLLEARPHLASEEELERPAALRTRLAEIRPGAVPRDASPLCRFLDRCPVRRSHCIEAEPPWQGDHLAGIRCWIAS